MTVRRLSTAQCRECVQSWTEQGLPWWSIGSLTALFYSLGKRKTFPSELREALMVTVLKKGARDKTCGTYRGSRRQQKSFFKFLQANCYHCFWGNDVYSTPNSRESEQRHPLCINLTKALTQRTTRRCGARYDLHDKYIRIMRSLHDNSAHKKKQSNRDASLHPPCLPSSLLP